MSNDKFGDELERRTGPAIRLGVCVFLNESDHAAIRRTVAKNGFALDQIGAAVLFYEPEFPCPPTPAWDAPADERRRHEECYAKWAAEIRPIKHLCLHPHDGVELRNWVSIVDALRVINQAPSERYAAFERAVPMSRDDQQRQRLPEIARMLPRVARELEHAGCCGALTRATGMGRARQIVLARI